MTPSELMQIEGRWLDVLYAEKVRAWPGYRATTVCKEGYWTLEQIREDELAAIERFGANRYTLALFAFDPDPSEDRHREYYLSEEPINSGWEPATFESHAYCATAPREARMQALIYLEGEKETAK